MIRKHPWFKKAIVLSALAATGVIVDSPDAEAANTTGTFQVQAKVVGACTLTAGNLVFPNYVSGQASTEVGSAPIVVSCAGAGPGPATVNAQLKMDTTSGFYRMVGPAPADILNYSLFLGSVGGTALPIATDVGVAITGTPQTVTVYGQIAASQTAVLGDYAQTVTATLTY